MIVRGRDTRSENYIHQCGGVLSKKLELVDHISNPDLIWSPETKLNRNIDLTVMEWM